MTLALVKIYRRRYVALVKMDSQPWAADTLHSNTITSKFWIHGSNGDLSRSEDSNSEMLQEVHKQVHGSVRSRKQHKPTQGQRITSKHQQAQDPRNTHRGARYRLPNEDNSTCAAAETVQCTSSVTKIVAAAGNRGGTTNTINATKPLSPLTPINAVQVYFQNIHAKVATTIALCLVSSDHVALFYLVLMVTGMQSACRLGSYLSTGVDWAWTHDHRQWTSGSMISGKH